MISKRNIWTLIQAAAVVLTLIAFSPLVLNPQVHTPYILGMPYSLGLGVIISILFIVLVILGAIFAPNDEGK